MDYGYVVYKDKLNDAYREAFSRVEIYSSTHLIDAKTDSEWMMELLDNMLSAQEAGEPVEKVVGTDIDKFCKEFFSRYTGEDRMQGMFRHLYQIAKWMLILEIIDGLFMLGEEGFFTGSSEVITPFLWGTTTGLLGNVIILSIINPLFLKKRKLSSEIYYTIVLLIFVLSIVVSIAMMGFVEEHFAVIMHRGILLAISGGYVLIYMITDAVRNYKRYGTVRVPKAPKVRMKDMVVEQLPKEWLKEFEKKNKRRVKQGKPELSNEEFMRKLTKRYDYKIIKRRNIIYTNVGGLIGFCIGVMAGAEDTLVGDGGVFESGLDLVIYLILVFCVATLIGELITRIFKPTCETFAGMKQVCGEKGWTVAEYVESMEHGKEEENQD